MASNKLSMFQEVATLFVLVFGLTSDGVVGFGVGAGLTFCGFVVLGSMGFKFGP